jgi:hypothetical protein
MSTLNTTNLKNASAASPAIVLAADGSATAQLSSINGGPLAGMRNRIINGDMRIDQRNAGGSITQGGGSYSVDRWLIYGTVSSKFTAQQNAGSVTPPAGFTNYLGITSSSAYSVTSGDQFITSQAIEGFNVADLGWGTANAQTVTISFWVRSSLTGLFGGCTSNDNYTRAYPFGFTVSSANTWEKKTVTIPGDTTGTWLSNNGAGIRLYFNLGSGSTQLGTIDTWGSFAAGPTGATSVVGTSGATFFLTGVQLEPGTVATPFERRSYGQELALCQRYYAKTYDQGTVPGTATSIGAISSSSQAATAYASAGTWQFPVTMRQAPTIILYSTQNANTVGKVSADSVDGTGEADFISDRNAFLRRQNDSTGVGANVYMRAQATASAEL